MDMNWYQQELDDLPSHIYTTDGRLLAVRLICPDDAPLLLDLFEHLSSETRRRRFHAGMDKISDERKQEVAELLANVDNRTLGGALLAIDEALPGGALVAVTRLARPDDDPGGDAAEAAIVVRDDYQRKGIGTELLPRLILLAKRMNVKTVIAEMEAGNIPALKLFRSLNLPATTVTHNAETIMEIAVPE